jgi:hypothetical protein
MPRLLWKQVQDIGPSPRAYPGMCFDEARRQVVLFGGGDRSDTWVWDDQAWVQVADTGPPQWHGYGMTYDAARQRIVTHRDVNTWEWDGSSWTQTADTGPSGLLGMSFDRSRQRVVLVTGSAGSLVAGSAPTFLETWEWDGTSWTQIDEHGPPMRSHFALAFDDERNVLVLHGGVGFSGSLWTVFGETWTWNGDLWRQVEDIGPKVSGHRLVHDPVRGRSVAFGGWMPAAPPAPSVASDDSWEWDGVHWKQIQDIGPQSRAGHGMTYDANSGSILLFGGLSSSYQQLGDTWRLAEYA